MKSEFVMEELIEIKKYSNRRLYDTDKSSYVTLADVADMIREGKELRVVDAKTGEDLTRTVMLQIICESKLEQEALPIAFLRRVIQAGNKTIRNSIKEYLSASMGAQREIQRQMTQWARVASMFNPFLSPLLPPQQQGGKQIERTSSKKGRKSRNTERNASKKQPQEPPPYEAETHDEHVDTPVMMPQGFPAEGASEEALFALQQQLALIQQQIEQMSTQRKSSDE